MKIIQEFKEFAVKGNALDLAVGVIIGAAFGKIVTSLVEQVVMPPVGLVLGQVDFSDLKWVLKAADPIAKTEEVAILYGAFFNTIIQFLIVAAAVFAMVKLVNSLRRADEAAPAPAEPPTPAAPTPTETLLAEIRDALKAKAAPAQSVAAKPAAAKAPARKPATKSPTAKTR